MLARPLLDRITEKTTHVGSCDLWQGSLGHYGYGQISHGSRGQISHGSRGQAKNIRVHRAVWEAHNGAIPAGLFVLHLCEAGYPPGDTTYRRCVRLEHLYLGTHVDNMRDMTESGRRAAGNRHGSILHPERLLRGDDHPSRRSPERLQRGDQHYSRTTPERLARGDRHGSRTHPDRIQRGTAVHNAKLTDAAVRAIRARVGGGETCAAVAPDYGVSAVMVSKIVRRKAWVHI